MSSAISRQQADFENIYNMITQAQATVWQQINKSLITLYWGIGEYVSNKVKNDSWGQSIVQKLSKYILAKNPASKGFSARNLWRMKKFYETYQDNEKLSALLTRSFLDKSSPSPIQNKNPRRKGVLPKTGN